jgi:HD-like signal output (HDOD) protein
MVVGFNHGSVGAGMLRAWSLPEAVIEAVAYHHRPTETSNPLATLVYLADAAAHVVGAVGGGGACRPPEWDMPAAEALGGRSEDIWSFLEGLQCVEETEL